jgi:hypothetical protein
LKDGRPFSSRIELDRIMLAQHFGGAGEFSRIGPSEVFPEARFDLFD